MATHLRSSAPPEPRPRDIGRRRFLGYLIAAPTLAVAVGTGIEVVAPGTPVVGSASNTSQMAPMRA